MSHHNLKITIILLVVSSLNACGGGGGSDGRTVGSLSIAAPSLAPADGTNAFFDAMPSASFTLANSTFQSASRSTLSCGATGQPKQAIAYNLSPVSAPVTSVTIVPTGGLTLGHSCTLVWLIDGTGGATDTRTVNFTVTALHYSDKVYALWNRGYPYAVTKTSVTRVVNKTRYIGFQTPIGCQIATIPLADGRILIDCAFALSPILAIVSYGTFYIDPATDEMYEVTGAVPTGISYIGRQIPDPAYPQWSVMARVSDGWYFATVATPLVLQFQPDGGAVATVKTGDPVVDQNLWLLRSYSN